jgi:uncharacterized membrane protein
MVHLNNKKTTTMTTGAILTATLVVAAAGIVLMFSSLSQEASAVASTESTITESIASGFEAGADEAESNDQTQLADEFRAVVDALRGGGDGGCAGCG